MIPDYDILWHSYHSVIDHCYDLIWMIVSRDCQKDNQTKNLWNRLDINTTGIKSNIRPAFVCLSLSHIRHKALHCDSLKIRYGRSDGWHSKVWNFVPETSGWTPNWTVAWRCAGKFPILIIICSRESLYEESVPEQLLKLQNNIVCIAVDDAHCVLQL